MISSTYNVVQFLDTPTGRTYYVLMEGVPGQIPAPADHPSGSVTITDPADPTRRGWGTYVFAAQPQRALSLSAPHLFDDAETELEAVEAFLTLGARTLLIAGTDRDQNTAKAPCAAVEPPLPGGRRVTYGGVGLPDGLRRDLLERRLHVAPPVPRERQSYARMQDVDVFLSNGVEATPSDLLLPRSTRSRQTSRRHRGPRRQTGPFSWLTSMTRRGTAAFAGRTTCR